MISVYQLKPGFQAILRPLVDKLARAGVTPNQITMSACLLAVVTGCALYWGRFSNAALLVLPGVLLVRMALNAMDGMLAREHQRQSRLGALLNEVTDVIGDAATYLPFCTFPGLGPWVAVVIWLAALSELSGAIAVQVGAQRRYDGPMGKSDRALVFALLAFVLAFGVAPGTWLIWVMAAVQVLLVLTILNRIRGALKEHHG